MRICYHGTNEEAADRILIEGFRDETWFAANLQDALAFGGNHVFRVVFDFEEAPGWQFLSEYVPPERIVEYSIYQKQIIKENRELGRKVFDYRMGDHSITL